VKRNGRGVNYSIQGLPTILRKITKSFRIVCVLAEIQTGNIQN